LRCFSPAPYYSSGRRNAGALSWFGVSGGGGGGGRESNEEKERLREGEKPM